ncbi:MAG: hypothetical protein FWE66_03975, partial [Oscillospiraceae bacterium]|nr:hypothetical protein [Oscillospiraceae bacterium]
MKAKRKKKFRTPANSSDNRIFRRFRLINILIFILAFGVMELLMTPAFVGVMNRVTAEYAERYAASSADALSSHIAKELSLMSRTAHSNALTEWMRDEYNEEKKTRAFSEMAGVVGELYSFNLYVGIKSSLNEYSVGPTDRQVASFDKNEPTDRWFFDCIESDRDYLLSVDRDHLLERKRMWIDYKVISDGEVLGVICTGLEFSHVAGELFSHYDSNDLRGIIIDDRGMVQMDSNLMNDREFLHETYEIPLESVVSDESLILAVRDYLSRTEGYTERLAHPEVVNLSSGYYRYLTITPIRHTNWSVLILSGLTSPFKMSYFIPVTTVALLLLIAFAVTSSAVNYRLIFFPLRKLNQSLELMAENPYQIIYGTDRDDELGSLSKTIHS